MVAAGARPAAARVQPAGVFVAGDVRHGSIKRVASAVGEGAMAIALLHTYLADPADGGLGTKVGPG